MTLLKDFLGNNDGFLCWKTQNSVGLLKYKDNGDATIIEDVINIQTDGSLKDLCDEFGVDFYD